LRLYSVNSLEADGRFAARGKINVCLLAALPCIDVFFFKLPQNFRRRSADNDTGRYRLMLFHHCALRDNGVFSDISEKTDYGSHADICAVAYIIPVDHCTVAERSPLSPSSFAEKNSLAGMTPRLH